MRMCEATLPFLKVVSKADYPCAERPSRLTRATLPNAVPNSFLFFNICASFQTVLYKALTLQAAFCNVKADHEHFEAIHRGLRAHF